MIRIVRLKISRAKLGFLLLILPLLSFGQQNHLSKKISLDFENQKLKVVFQEIEKKGNFALSYNAELINLDSSISIKVNKEKVSIILNSLFPKKNFGYKSIGKHLVLYSKIPKENPPLKIQGYIVDARSGEKIKNATIYDPENSFTASSDGNGFYEITVKSSKESIGLSYSKLGYRDSVVFVKEKEITKNNIYLIPLPQKESLLNPKELDPIVPSVEERKLVQWIVPEEQINSSKNLKLFENKIGQVSFLPLIGTNGSLSGNITNNFSLNVFSGYSKGINGIEVGGFLNIIREDVVGTQISGFANITGNETEGAQVAGFFNYNGGDLLGAQVAGFTNLLIGNVNGVQAAGFANTLKGKMNGAQLAGFSNLTTADVDGFQVAGFTNVALGDVRLAQISGFSNYGNNVEGFQAAGYFNFAYGDVKSLQAAGFANIAKGNSKLQAAGFANITFKNSEIQVSGFSNLAFKNTTVQATGFGNLAFKNSDFQISGFSNLALGNSKLQATGFANFTLEKVEGAQISGFFNYARSLNGFQISTINITDTVFKGAPIGLLSFVNTGVHSFEISMDDLIPLNFCFRTGVPAFYNILKLGIGPEYQRFAYGIGSRLAQKEKWDLNLEALLSVIYSESNNGGISFDGNLFKLQPLFSYQIYKSLRVNFGPTFNLALQVDIDGIEEESLVKQPILRGTWDQKRDYHAWFGFQLGLQLF